MKPNAKQKINEIARKILPVLIKHGVKKSGIFGSYARGEENKSSDIDILVEIGTELSLLDFIGLKLELEKKLKNKVDLVEYSVIKSAIREDILREEVSIL